MKRLTSLLLAAMLLLLFPCAWAAAPKVSDSFHNKPIDVLRDEREKIFTITPQGEPFSYEVLRKVPGTTDTWDHVTNIQTGEVELTGNHINRPTDLYWDFWYEGDNSGLDGGHLHKLKVFYGEKFFETDPFFVIWLSQADPDRDRVSWKNQIDRPLPDAKWYSANTATSFGPHFRNLAPELTDKWYMFTPVDLSKDGVQSFDLVASNMYEIGKVFVTVQGDTVTVNYKNVCSRHAGLLMTNDEFFTVFHDLNDVKTVNPEEMPGNAYRFGQPFSIQKMLDGDTNVLLFVRNVVSYRDYITDTVKLKRFYENRPHYRALRQQMLDMMDPIR